MLKTSKFYNANEYWQERHQKTDLSTVGFIGLGLPFNSWMYHLRKKIFKQTIAEENINTKHVKILDVGSGSGFYIQCWQDAGAKNLTASDFSTNAISQISKNFPRIKTCHLDITQPIPSALKRKFDIVSAFDIFYHIVDDNKYAQAFKNIYDLLKPHGLFIFSENLPAKTQIATHQVSRSRKIIFSIMKKNSLVVKKVSPIFYLMNSPICSTNPVIKTYWFLMQNSLAKLNFLGQIFGPGLYFVDLMLAKTKLKGPSTKILVAQKQ